MVVNVGGAPLVVSINLLVYEGEGEGEGVVVSGISVMIGLPVSNEVVVCVVSASVVGCVAVVVVADEPVVSPLAVVINVPVVDVCV